MTGFFSWRLKFLFVLLSVALVSEPIDVVIPCHPKDFPILEECVRGIRENGKDVRRIIVVTEQVNQRELRKIIRLFGVEIFPEEAYPFNIEKVGLEVGCHDNRGWFFQQLLKIYAFSMISGLTDHILLLDADTVFLNPCEFVTEDGKTLFTPSKRRHNPYFLHAERLVPSFQENSYGLSGICNFMVFRRDVIAKLMREVEVYHKKPFWKAFLHEVEPDWRHWVGASEYEIYFNYFLANYPQEYSLQTLKWDESLKHIRSLQQYKEAGYHFVTCHHWQR